MITKGTFVHTNDDEAIQMILDAGEQGFTVTYNIRNGKYIVKVS
jgi:hypothetical protein